LQFLYDVCYVYSGIGDEAILRREVRELKTKFHDLTAAFLQIQDFAKTVDGISVQLQNMKMLNNENRGRPSYLNVAKQGRRERHVTGASKPATPASPSSINNKNAAASTRLNHPTVSPPMSQKVAMGRMSFDTYSSTAPDTAGVNDDEFTIVQRRRKSHKPKTGAIVGGSTGSNVRSAPKRRMGMLFLTRCDVDTTTEDIQKHISENVDAVKLIDVESWETKYKTYASFKITFDIAEKSLSAFFREIIRPELWPEGTLIKPFGLKTMLKNPQRII